MSADADGQIKALQTELDTLKAPSTAQELHQSMLQSLRASGCSAFNAGNMQALLTDTQSNQPGECPLLPYAMADIVVPLCVGCERPIQHSAAYEAYTIQYGHTVPSEGDCDICSQLQKCTFLKI